MLRFYWESTKDKYYTKQHTDKQLSTLRSSQEEVKNKTTPSSGHKTREWKELKRLKIRGYQASNINQSYI